MAFTIGRSVLGLKTRHGVRMPLPRVAIIVETAIAPRRRILAGITQYIREHEPWSIYLKPAGVERFVSRWLRDWKGDGIIAAAYGPEVAEITTVGVPAVDVTGQLQHLKLQPPVPLVHADDHAIGRLGAEHLIDRNFRHFAFLGYRQPWSESRRLGFEGALQARAFTSRSHIFSHPFQSKGGPDEWEAQQRALVKWIHSLPKPVGVMTSTDALGQQFLESCQRIGVVVPEQVAVIGADNDVLICDIAHPPLSSVNIDDFQRGYQAASMLSVLMAGKRPKQPAVLIPPAGVTARASTDILAIDDPDLAQAIRFIREHGCQPIQVSDILRHIPISRRVLERRLRNTLGRSIKDEIVRVRLNRATELLTTTDLGLKEIALKAGFRTKSYMGVVFREKLRRTPGSLRNGRQGP